MASLLRSGTTARRRRTYLPAGREFTSSGRVRVRNNTTKEKRHILDGTSKYKDSWIGFLHTEGRALGALQFNRSSYRGTPYPYTRYYPEHMSPRPTTTFCETSTASYISLPPLAFAPRFYSTSVVGRLTPRNRDGVPSRRHPCNDELCGFVTGVVPGGNWSEGVERSGRACARRSSPGAKSAAYLQVSVGSQGVI